MFIKIQLYAIRNNEIRIAGISREAIYHEDPDPKINIFRFRYKEMDGSISKDMEYLRKRLRKELRNNSILTWESAFRNSLGKMINFKKQFLL